MDLARRHDFFVQLPLVAMPAKLVNWRLGDGRSDGPSWAQQRSFAPPSVGGNASNVPGLFSTYRPHERSLSGEAVTNGTNATVVGLIKIVAKDHPMGAARGEWLRPGQEASPNHTVLIVEDEVFVRFMIADELRSAGYKVIEAATADQALDVLAHIAGVSVVISDIRMPGSMDGLRFARRVRSEYPSIRIVLTSGDVMNVDSVDHDGFFPKPYDVKEIINHIKTLFD